MSETPEARISGVIVSRINLSLSIIVVIAFDTKQQKTKWLKAELIEILEHIYK